MHMYVYIHTYVCMHACMHVCMYVCTCVCMRVCMCVCMHACIHACMQCNVMSCYVMLCSVMYVYTYMYARSRFGHHPGRTAPLRRGWGRGTDTGSWLGGGRDGVSGSYIHTCMHTYIFCISIYIYIYYILKYYIYIYADVRNRVLLKD